MTTFNILVVNPKDQETQIAVYDNYKLRYMIARKHSNKELAAFDSIYDQVTFRKDIILKELANNQFALDEVRVVISRGGLVHPVQSGVYEVNEQLKHDLIHSTVGDDVINIGGLLAAAVAAEIPGAQAMIADPTVVDELQEIARITGAPGIVRKSIFHALNQKAVGNLHAETHKLKYEDLNLIIAHMGNGTTVGAHRKGRVIDVNQGFAGDGPFSLVRAGTLPLGDVVELCFSGTKSKEQIECLITHCGGLNGLLGTTSINEVEQRIKNGDEQAKLVLEAMAYQVAKCIGEMYAVLKGEVDAILITGDVAYSDFVVRIILDHVEKFAPIFIYAGDNEIKFMAANALRIIKGEMSVKTYS
ncbi:MAG: butyrate kinase [Bacteroidetes bacterium]|nr:MAG: butyrate kinase [Bacteroidota bacterium]